MSHRLWAGVQRLRDEHASMFDDRPRSSARRRRVREGIRYPQLVLRALSTFASRPRDRGEVGRVGSRKALEAPQESSRARLRQHALGRSRRRGGVGGRSARRRRHRRRLRGLPDGPRSVSRGEGILLALASKNDEAAVWEASTATDRWCCGRDDLVASKVNWNDKTVSLRELADELDLGLDASCSGTTIRSSARW